MENPNQYLHEVAIVAIIFKDNRFLITRRDLKKKRSPGKWTIPGGKLETSDYKDLPKDTELYWYNVLEKTLKREVEEEVGLHVNNVEYVASCATIHPDGAPSIVLTCMADWLSGEVKLQEGETDKHAWVTVEEAKTYDFIDGIYEELVMAELRRKGQKVEWQRF